ncbi:hypothetical protein L3Q82_023426 [Scortum barcoo]|uniref:Uncharacterized protein n=1 Tax=Scortum barcoo TaxID=214431 RepID=A0ACB8WZ25_9TELE|nr:hypothetical protein L3Q82_023426 [Scortum barcoo]
MEPAECPPVTVEGSWRPDQTRTVRNKLQLYFQSKKKSSGGDCRVEAEEGAPRAAVYFRSEEVRERVLARKNHEIVVGDQTISLRLISASSPASSSNIADPSADSKTPKSEVRPGNGASANSRKESVQSVAVVLDNVNDNMSKDLLAMMVENVSGLDESDFSLEIIWETSRAVVKFTSPTGGKTAGNTQIHISNHTKTRHGEFPRWESMQPEAAETQTDSSTSGGSEQRPSGEPSLRLWIKNFEEENEFNPFWNKAHCYITKCGKKLLDLYFEKNWAMPDNIVMIPTEQAAIVTFSDPKVVESICTKQDYVMRSIPVKMYPFYESLGTALYGKDRPTWKMPEPFTESVHHVIWKFLQMKKLSKRINDQMLPYFCSVGLENPERPAPAWKAAEKDVRSVVKEDVVVVMDASRGILTVAGQANSIKQLRAPVENIVLKAMHQIKRQTDGVSEQLDLSPAMIYILKQEGLQRAVLDISTDMKVSYDEGTQKLTITGLLEELLQTKSWILERKMGMSKKHLNLPPHLLDFLKSVDPMEMSQHLFTSQGISAFYSVESQGLFLMGSSDSALSEAESKMKMALALQTLDVEDQEVLKLKNWKSLNQQLMDTYNSSTKKTVAIQIHPERRDKITVAGFQTPVKEVSRSLQEFIVNYSEVQETIRVESCAVVQFIDKKKSQDCFSIAKANQVLVHFDKERPKILISGARLHVQKAKSCIWELTSALSTDTLIVDKPGAKKYFMSLGRLFLSSVMTELDCMVVLHPENQDEEEEEENYEEENDISYCRVKTTSGVLVSVSKADICSFNVDAVVNAANEDLQHIGGLALALLKAAGPELQKISNDYIAENGKLRPGDAIVTGACNLPCKFVVHAVGPRFSDNDKKTSVTRLKVAVQESLRQAEKVNCSSIALPAISSGVFGFPVELCAETIANAVRDYCDSPGSRGSLTEIHLVDNNDKTVRVLATAVSREFSDLGPTMTTPPQARGGRVDISGVEVEVRTSRPEAEEEEEAKEETKEEDQEEGKGQDQEEDKEGDQGEDMEEDKEKEKELGGMEMDCGEASRVTRKARAPQDIQDLKGMKGMEVFALQSAWMEQTTAEGLKIVLLKGNIQDQTTDVIINTIAENMNLNQGAVSKAILEAAGPGLQSAVQSEAGVATLQYGDVIVTDGLNLMCQKVFHSVCPFWDSGKGQAEEELISIVRYCLEEAEKRKMASLSFPAIGTGNLGFPRDVVSRVLLKEIHLYSRRRTPHHLRKVAIVVHPSDGQTVDCFTREFKGQAAPRNFQQEPQEFIESPGGQPVSQSQQTSASVGQVSSPSLGVYRMQMGQLTFEVSSGDITKEACDVIINSSNQDFTLKSVNSPGYQPRPMILTSAGQLPSRNILHIVGLNDPAKIKEMVYSVLKVCEENNFSSVAFPALGTGQGGANPSLVAEAMVGAIVEFVRKKRPKFVHSVKILIFQTVMTREFHKIMKKRGGEELEEKSVFTKIKDTFTSWFTGPAEEQPSAGDLVLEKEEFEPTVFQLCADNNTAISQAKKRIKELIVAEQAEKTITDQYISQLSQDDMDELNALQRKLTVSIRLDKGREDQEPKIHLEGLTRDVLTAESTVRDIIRRVEKNENLKKKALLLSEQVEWQFQHQNGNIVSFDIFTNLKLEEALEVKQTVRIKINNETYNANVMLKKASTANGHKMVELLRKDLKDDITLPSDWDDMKGDLVKQVPLPAGSKTYQEVEKEVTKTGLKLNIISIERVQNPTLWQNYQLMKKQMEKKNKHTNNERMLFHGTKDSAIDRINKQGFNRSYAGTHVGAAIGNGSYFAVDPAYSAGGYAVPDANGHKRMYLAKVLVGDFTQGRKGMIAPPAKNTGSSADLYDSVTDQNTIPTMFVVFNDIQAYPEYLITFT